MTRPPTRTPVSLTDPSGRRCDSSPFGALVLLCGPGSDPEKLRPLLEALGGEPGQLLLAAPELGSHLSIGTHPPPHAARLVAALEPGTGLLGSLQAALLACTAPQLIAVDGAAPPPPAALLRRLAADPRPGNVLLCEWQGELPPLPGRFRRGCLGPLARACRQGASDLELVLRGLPCSRLSGHEVRALLDGVPLW